MKPAQNLRQSLFTLGGDAANSAPSSETQYEPSEVNQSGRSTGWYSKPNDFIWELVKNAAAIHNQRSYGAFYNDFRDSAGRHSSVARVCHGYSRGTQLALWPCRQGVTCSKAPRWRVCPQSPEDSFSEITSRA